MSYVINNSRGNIIAVVPDGTANTTAVSLTLVGRALSNYGLYENENYVYLLENFAKDTAPTAPVLGQLWYNSNTDVISSYNSTNTWSALASQTYVQAQKVSPAFSGVPTAPTAPSGTANTQIATTAFVTNSVQLAGTPTAPTAANGASTTQIATTAFVQNQLQQASAIVVTGNITGGNVLINGIVSAAGNIYGSNFVGNIVSPAGSQVSTTGNITGGNVLTNGIVSAAGNISTGGTFSATGNIATISTIIANTVIANTVIATGTTSAFRLPNLSQLQINALSPSNGDMVYNITVNLPQVYQNGQWFNFTISYYS